MPIDSVRLIQEDWDTLLRLSFPKGRLLIRSIPMAGRKGSRSAYFVAYCGLSTQSVICNGGSTRSNW